MLCQFQETLRLLTINNEPELLSGSQVTKNKKESQVFGLIINYINAELIYAINCINQECIVK